MEDRQRSGQDVNRRWKALPDEDRGTPRIIDTKYKDPYAAAPGATVPALQPEHEYSRPIRVENHRPARRRVSFDDDEDYYWRPSMPITYHVSSRDGGIPRIIDTKYRDPYADIPRPPFVKDKTAAETRETEHERRARKERDELEALKLKKEAKKFRERVREARRKQEIEEARAKPKPYLEHSYYSDDEQYFRRNRAKKSSSPNSTDRESATTYDDHSSTGATISRDSSADESVRQDKPLADMGKRSQRTRNERDMGSTSAEPRTYMEDFDEEPTHRSDFKVAIICALTLESDAVQDVFDKRWDEFKYGKMPGDPNQYTTGAIGRHNVVVVHMPGMGKSNGAAAAANCRASFSNLGLVLVVGICGGVPFTRTGSEIVLGDVVVSDGLIEYDFGRQFPDRFVRKNDRVARPNSEILSFLAKMKGRWGMKRLRERTAIHLEYLRTATDLGQIANYPGAWKDILYEPAYRHKHQVASACEICTLCQTKNDPVCEAALTLDCVSLQCDENHHVTRTRLAILAEESEGKNNKAEPSIHFGLYASGDKVMKSGEEREIIAKEQGILAFEMEGAGVWEGFPGRCLVIKAVCDYADSHKNKIWQTYAAASAAACTKALLESWSP